MSIPYRGPLARGTDRSTSHAGAQDARGPRTGSQRLRLLREYGKHPLTGLTAYEAASVAGLLDVGYWKRVSDLFNDGFIEPNGEERKAPWGRKQAVLVITEQGKRELKESGQG